MIKNLLKIHYNKTFINLKSTELSHRNDVRWYGGDYKNTLVHDINNLKIEWLKFKLSILDSII